MGKSQSGRNVGEPNKGVAQWAVFPIWLRETPKMKLREINNPQFIVLLSSQPCGKQLVLVSERKSSTIIGLDQFCYSHKQNLRASFSTRKIYPLV
ncbi:hypothetical protein TNCV_3963481 [Trichonephila clavipes]|nr:hypothetical protein TNCV_3963481 [Trichonephila clavipes]